MEFADEGESCGVDGPEIRPMSEPFTHKLYAIVDALHEAKISHSLVITRDDAITILAAVPGERWEIDVFSTGASMLKSFAVRVASLRKMSLRA